MTERRENKNEGATVFKTQTKADGTTHEYFNRGRRDGARHGHRVTINHGTPDERTIYVRDNEGTEYDVSGSKK